MGHRCLTSPMSATRSARLNSNSVGSGAAAVDDLFGLSVVDMLTRQIVITIYDATPISQRPVPSLAIRDTMRLSMKIRETQNVVRHNKVRCGVSQSQGRSTLLNPSSEICLDHAQRPRPGAQDNQETKKDEKSGI